MTPDELPPELRRTEERIRAALAGEASSVDEDDLREVVAAAPAGRRSGRSLMVAAAAVVILLGGTVTVLSLTSRGHSGLAATSDSSGPPAVTTPSSSPVLTVAELPGSAHSSVSCAYGGFKGYADDAVRRGDALVTGTLRPTGKTTMDEDDGMGWRSLQVDVTIDTVLAGTVRTRTTTAWVASGAVFLSPPPAPSSGVTVPSETGPVTPTLDYEGNGGWAVDGAFLGLLRQNTGGENAIIPIPLIDDRAVVGLGCWSSGGLPTTREQVELVLSAEPPLIISVPVDLVALQDIRDSLH